MTTTRKKNRRGAPKTITTAKRMANCEVCDTPLRWRSTTSAKPHAIPDYGFTLKVTGISTATCTRCGATYMAVGNVPRFRETVLEQILKKPGALTADEIIFLRKQLRLTGGKFAGLVGVSREHVSHIEQGHAPSLGTAADRLARMIIAAKTDSSLKLLKRVISSLPEEIGTRSRRKSQRHPGYRVAMGGSKRG
jgi:DNA-binding transcriptional regulator YiaG